VSGEMGILADHVPTIAELSPGVVTVQPKADGGESLKWFVSGGYCIVNPDSTASISAVEAVSLADLDPVLCKKGLEDSKAALARGNTDREKAEAQISVDVYQAMAHALGIQA